jgi:FKBP-type peptidyl-prolyl cis-trans isomerase SlyD
VIESGKNVAIEYTLTLEDGTVVDSNVGNEPLVYEAGGGQILPALDAALIGLSEGDTRSVDLPAEHGYGVVDEKLMLEVPLEHLPEDARQIGTPLVAQGEGGQELRVRVHQITDDAAILDYNHPLAGESLSFSVRVVSVT